MRPSWDVSDDPRDAAEGDGLEAIVQFLSWLVTGGLSPHGEPRRHLSWRPLRREPDA
jgi:hypothetical protein